MHQLSSLEEVAAGTAPGAVLPDRPAQGPGLVLAPAEEGARSARRRSAGGLSRRGLQHAVLATDALCALGTAAFLVLLQGSADSPAAAVLAAYLAAGVLGWWTVFAALGLHRGTPAGVDEEPHRLLAATSAGVLCLTALGAASGVVLSTRAVLPAWLLALAAEAVSRQGWRVLAAHLEGAGRLCLRTVVVGGPEAHDLSERLRRTGSGYLPVAVLGASWQRDPDRAAARLRRLVHAQRADCLFASCRGLDPSAVSVLCRTARQEGLDLHLEPSLSQVLGSRLRVRTRDDGVTLVLPPSTASLPQRVLKRGLDVVVAGLALVLLAPVLLLIALAVRLSSPGPALFRQPRVTQGGTTFVMLKFRTMRVTPPDRLMDLTTPFFKLADDPRLTTVGRLLRRTSLDELPQLLNVLRGDMSLVGPRPLPLEQVLANPGMLAARHEVRGGLTGWWQVNGRSSMPAEQAVAMDSFYIENWSLGLDLWILWRTVGAVLRRTGAC